jgi:GST-like protein
MIEFHYAATPNGLKVALLLAEASIRHRVELVRLGAGEQDRPNFRAISPNGKIPAIVDHEPLDGGAPLALFESGAILLYLADKHRAFLGAGPRDRLAVLQWLCWQVGGLGPMAGQIGHFAAHAPEHVPYAIDRYTREVARLYGVLDQQLAGREFIVGTYSIADMACYPWIVPHHAHGQDLGAFPNLRRWFDRIAARPATQRVYDGVADVYARGVARLSDAERRVLFSAGAQSAPAQSQSLQGERP